MSEFSPNTKNDFRDDEQSCTNIDKTWNSFCKTIRCVNYIIFISFNNQQLHNFLTLYKLHEDEINKSCSITRKCFWFPHDFHCNSSACKHKILLTAQESIIEHTIRLSQFLFNALDIRDARKEPQSFDPKSIKDKVEEVGTMSKGDA